MGEVPLYRLQLSAFAVPDRLKLLKGHVIDPLGGVPREQKMLKGHLPRVIYHYAY